MKYEEALSLWGHQRLTRAGYTGIDPDSIEVTFSFREGYNCCGGTDPLCYCSMAESPRAEVIIVGVATGQTGNKYFRPGYAHTSIDFFEFNFSTVLKELLDIGSGTFEVGT